MFYYGYLGFWKATPGKGWPRQDGQDHFVRWRRILQDAWCAWCGDWRFVGCFRSLQKNTTEHFPINSYEELKSTQTTTYTFKKNQNDQATTVSICQNRLLNFLGKWMIQEAAGLSVGGGGQGLASGGAMAQTHSNIPYIDGCAKFRKIPTCYMAFLPIVVKDFASCWNKLDELSPTLVWKLIY